MVSVFLPEIDSVVAEPRVPRDGRALGGSERILFVDDEPAVAESCAALLSGEGYSVVTAASGAEALDHFRTNFCRTGSKIISFPSIFLMWKS